MGLPQNTLTVLQNTLRVELNALTLPDVSVEEHGQVVEGQGVDGSATEQLVLQNTLTVELNGLTLPDISVEKHRLYYRTP